MVRKKCEKDSKSRNKTDWTNFRPKFVNVVADWDCIIESWMKEEWMRQSKVGVENRKKVPGDVEGMSSYVRHTAGSKSFRVHTHELEKKTGKPASKVDEFERLHKRNKGKGVWCDTRSEKVMTTYKESIKAVDGAGLDSTDVAALDSPDSVGLDSPSSGIPFDSEAWDKAIGDPKVMTTYKDKCLTINKRPCLITSESLMSNLCQYISSKLFW